VTVEPKLRRFQRSFGPAYNGIAAAEDFIHDTFVLLASDPLVRCAGYDLDGLHHECADGVEIRVRMHDSGAPHGRSTQRAERAPYGQLRCVTCGSRQHVPAFAANAKEAT
jgi:hypothetical protein